jgi:hypothetical protein
MGATELKFNGTLESSSYLKDFECSHCDKFITESDIEKSNYRLLVSDYANEVKKEQFLAPRLGRNLTYYGVNFWLKSVEHQDCPSD